MERSDALVSLRALAGSDLRLLAAQYGVTVHTPDGLRTNKGWAGHVIERHLGLALNSAQAPNFGSWELKVVPVWVGPDGKLRVKETMAITMIDPVEVARNPWEESHVYRKLRRMVVVSRVFENKAETRSLVHGAFAFDLTDPVLHDVLKADYETVRCALHAHDDVRQGFLTLTGKMGTLIQPRTKGAGHGSTSRAFYARPCLVAHILGLGVLPDLCCTGPALEAE